MNEKKSVAAFKKKYHLKYVNSATLWDVLTLQGYTIVEFSSINNTDDVQTLIEALKLQEQILCSKCFTFQNDKYRLVFLNEDLNDEERTIVLAHEEGHIWSEHLSKDDILGKDVIQEYEANQFVHYLLQDRTGEKSRTRLLTVVVIMVTLFGLISGLFMKQKYDSKIYADNLYRTETGSKYHLRDCMYIQNKTNIHHLTKEEFNSGLYEPCGACKPIK